MPQITEFPMKIGCLREASQSPVSANSQDSAQKLNEWRLQQLTRTCFPAILAKIFKTAILLGPQSKQI